MTVCQTTMSQHGGELCTPGTQANVALAGEPQSSQYGMAVLGFQACCIAVPWLLSKRWLVASPYSLWVPGVVQAVVVISRSKTTSLPCEQPLQWELFILFTLGGCCEQSSTAEIHEWGKEWIAWYAKKPSLCHRVEAHSWAEAEQRWCSLLDHTCSSTVRERHGGKWKNLDMRAAFYLDLLIFCLWFPFKTIVTHSLYYYHLYLYSFLGLDPKHSLITHYKKQS